MQNRSILNDGTVRLLGMVIVAAGFILILVQYLQNRGRARSSSMGLPNTCVSI